MSANRICSLCDKVFLKNFDPDRGRYQEYPDICICENPKFAKEIPPGFIDIAEDLLPFADKINAQSPTVFKSATDIPRLVEYPDWIDAETRLWLEERKKMRNEKI